MAHLNYYLDLAVEAYIVNDRAVLLRLHEKYGMWNGPGGHLDPGEDPNEAVKREVWEEAGLEIELIGPPHWEKQDSEFNIDLVPPLFVNRHHITDTHDHSGLIFAATTDTRDTNPQTEADKGAEFKWLTKSELKDLAKIDKRLRTEALRYALIALDLAK